MIEHPAAIIQLEAIRQARQAIHQATQQIDEFKQAVFLGQYEDYVDEIRDAQREVLLKKAKLFPKELQVVQGVVVGKLLKEIAYELGLSEVTIKSTYLRDAKKKLSDAAGHKITTNMQLALLYFGVTQKTILAEQKRQTESREETPRNAKVAERQTTKAQISFATAHP